MKKSVSLIVPTHNRHNFLARLLEYYRAVSELVIVVDSSSSEFDANRIPPGVRYLHVSGVSYTEKLRKALSIADTPFVQLVADDDFVLIDAVKEGLNFLEQNRDFSSVQGWHIGFTYTPPEAFSDNVPSASQSGIPVTKASRKLNTVGAVISSGTEWISAGLKRHLNNDNLFLFGGPTTKARGEQNSEALVVSDYGWQQSGPFIASVWHSFAKDRKIISENPLERIKAGLNPYMNNFYALHRKEVLTSYYLNLSPLLETCGADSYPQIRELAQAINTFFWGKTTTLQRPWVCREALPYAMSSVEMAPLNQLRDANDAIYDGFIDSLTEHFTQISPSPDLREQLVEGLDDFIDVFTPAWNSGSIPHMTDISEMVHETEDIARLDEIRSVVVKHNAQLSPNWNKD